MNILEEWKNGLTIDEVEELLPRSIRSASGTLLVPKLFLCSEIVAIDAEFGFEAEQLVSIVFRPALRRATSHWTAQCSRALDYLQRMLSVAGENPILGEVPWMTALVEEEWGDFHVSLTRREHRDTPALSAHEDTGFQPSR